MSGNPEKTILLVDDEPEMRHYLSRLLSRENFRLLVAAEGEAALSLSVGFAGIIDLLITDVMMPVMNGKDLADRLCALRPELKVLFISGYNRADLWPNDVCEDQTDWLPKPFTASDFHRKVAQLLDLIRKT